MRMLVATIAAYTVIAASGSAMAQSCKTCADQQKACMKNYAGPACTTEYKMCLKACKK